MRTRPYTSQQTLRCPLGRGFGHVATVHQYSAEHFPVNARASASSSAGPSHARTISALVLGYLPLAGMAATIAIIAMQLATSAAWSAQSSAPVARPKLLAAWLMGAALLAWIGALTHRFSVRAFPLRASGTRRRWLIALHAIMALGGLVVALPALLLLAGITTQPPTPRESLAERVLVGSLEAYFVGQVGALVAGVACLAMSIAVVSAVGVWRHAHPADWMLEDHVLFLRSFGSIADTSVLHPILRGSLGRARVVLLAAPGTLWRTWNPTALALAGFSLLRPFRSVAVFLESTNARWLEDVRCVAQSARLVIVDATHDTPGVREELRVLRALDPPVPVALLRDDRITAPSDLSINGTTIAYRSASVRWRSLAPIMVFAFVAWFVLLVVAIAMIEEETTATSRWWPLVAAIPLAVMNALPFAALGRVTSETSRALQRRVRSLLEGQGDEGSKGALTEVRSSNRPGQAG